MGSNHNPGNGEAGRKEKGDGGHRPSATEWDGPRPG